MGLVFLVVVTIQAFTMALNAIRVGTVAMYATETPLGYPQLILGISLSLFALQLIVEIARKARFIL
jgi:ABC-type spermidine/putrescine transport system permease subunit II